MPILRLTSDIGELTEECAVPGLWFVELAQSSPTPESWFTIVTQGGAIGALLLVLFGFFRGWWVFGRELEEARKREEVWKELAMRSAEAAEAGTVVATRLADRKLEELAQIVHNAEEAKSRLDAMDELAKARRGEAP